MDELISRNALIAEYDRVHVGAPGGERRLMQDAQAVNRWIPCSERLPESEREVLVYVKGDFDNSIPFITTAYINSDHDWQSDYDGEVIDSKISHWMPMPEPPEKE